MKLTAANVVLGLTVLAAAPSALAYSSRSAYEDLSSRDIAILQLLLEQRGINPSLALELDSRSPDPFFGAIIKLVKKGVQGISNAIKKKKQKKAAAKAAKAANEANNQHQQNKNKRDFVDSDLDARDYYEFDIRDLHMFKEETALLRRQLFAVAKQWEELASRGYGDHVVDMMFERGMSTLDELD